jgi:hypothetical protein
MTLNQRQLDAACGALHDLYVGDGGWIGRKAAEEQVNVIWRAIKEASPDILPPASAKDTCP